MKPSNFTFKIPDKKVGEEAKTTSAPNPFCLPSSSTTQPFSFTSLLAKSEKPSSGKFLLSKIPTDKGDVATQKPINSRIQMPRMKDSVFSLKRSDADGNTDGNKRVLDNRSRYKLVNKALPRKPKTDLTVVHESTIFVDSSGDALKPIRPHKKAPLFAPFKRKDPAGKNIEKIKEEDVFSDGIEETDNSSSIFGPLKAKIPTMFGVELAPSVAKSLEGNAEGREKMLPIEKPKLKFSNIKTREDLRTMSPNQKDIDEGRILKKLAELRGRECPGEYDKYAVLDERDKLLYQLREIGSDLIKRLERCEEMCTEKERYTRIVQKRAAPFECNEENEVSHEAMVKEYARSAADQERPLPHELRSEKMMNQTMAYLLHDVLDKIPESVEQRASWYNFLWSRTRAVRKEVTQLSMSDELALNLVERCTRLHILFGYILCDLETDHFDQKMNNENLGKCLQTLRHLYEDFERRGIPCVNEAEFRSYDVMLHMKDTNVLSQVLSYRNEVRRSDHVCLALELAANVQNNNYCRLFRLLKTKATFLQCCVSHKFFNNIRWDAMYAVVRSYGRNATHPIEKITDLLAFDSTEEATKVMKCFGLVTDTGGEIVLNKDFLELAEQPKIQNYRWIDAKRNGNFSQVVYGPEKFQFFGSSGEISNSFDFHGRFVNDKVLNTILSSSSFINIPSDSLSFAKSGSALSMQVTIEEKRKMDAERIKKQMEKKRLELTEKLTIDIVDQVVLSIANEERMKEKMIRKQRKMIEMERIKNEEKRRKEEEILRKRKEIEEGVARKIIEEMENELVENMVRIIAQDQIRVERCIREERIVSKITDNVWNKKVSKIIDNRILGICAEMVNEKKLIKEGLAKFKNRMTRRWLLQFWNRWRDWTIQRRESRNRRHQMLQRCVPNWDHRELESEFVRKYGGSSEDDFTILSTNSIRLISLQRRRKTRITKDVIRKWRDFAKTKRVLREMAENIQKRQEEFFERIANSSTDCSNRGIFTFDSPKDLEKTLKQKRKISEDYKENFQYQSMRVFDDSLESDLSMCIARTQIETGNWKCSPVIPMELKEKLKRERDSLSTELKDHERKRRKEANLMSKEAKEQTKIVTELTDEVEILLQEAAKLKNEMSRMKEELFSRKVADL